MCSLVLRKELLNDDDDMKEFFDDISFNEWFRKGCSFNKDVNKFCFNKINHFIGLQKQMKEIC